MMMTKKHTLHAYSAHTDITKREIEDKISIRIVYILYVNVPRHDMEPNVTVPRS